MNDSKILKIADLIEELLNAKSIEAIKTLIKFGINCHIISVEDGIDLVVEYSDRIKNHG